MLCCDKYVRHTYSTCMYSNHDIHSSIEELRYVLFYPFLFRSKETCPFFPLLSKYKMALLFYIEFYFTRFLHLIPFRLSLV